MVLSRNKKGTIYEKIFALTLFFGLFFIILFFAILYYLKEEKNDVYNKTKKQFEYEVNAIINLSAQTNISNILDIVYWDDLQKYVINKKNVWFQKNIVTSLKTYNADYLGIYDIEGNFVRKHSNDKIYLSDFIPKPVFIKLKSKRLLKFYLMLPEGIVEVYGATIHPSSDIDYKITKASGYFFIVRRYDQTYLQSLESISNFKISFSNDNLKTINKSVVVIKDLLTWDRQVLKKVYFERQFDVSFYIMEYIVYILILTFLIYIIISLYYTHKWVYKPLKLIGNILENINNKDIALVKNVPGEFKNISFLIKRNDEHKKLLEKAKAKAEESDKLKSAFLTNISHEIRTPINAINGFSDLLSNEMVSDNERREYTEIIKHSSSNLVSIIDDLLEMSKIETNQVTPNYTLVNLTTVLHNLHKAIQITISENKDIDFLLIPPNNPIKESVITDQIKLLQILTNLITNAIKYTKKGMVSFGYDYNLDGELYFTVKDTGIGIDKKQHTLIFDRFHRVDSELAIKAGGLGLGLAISKAYVGLLGGHISLKSKVNVGTTFSFTIAPQIDLEITPVLSKSSNHFITEVNTQLTILVAEDNYFNFRLLDKILTLNLHIVLQAKDGEEAVKQCQNNPQIDLVLMDINMPVLNGYEAFKLIKVFRPDLIIIAQTACSATEDQQKIITAGFYGYLSKPIDKMKLIEAVSNVMKLKKTIE